MVGYAPPGSAKTAYELQIKTDRTYFNVCNFRDFTVVGVRNREKSCYGASVSMKNHSFEA